MLTSLSSYRFEGFTTHFKRAIYGVARRFSALIVAVVGIVGNQVARADLVSFSVDMTASAKGNVNGEWTQGEVLRTPKHGQATAYRVSAAWTQNQAKGGTVWELTGSRHQQDLQVLGRMNVGPLRGFYTIEMARLTMEDLSLAWRRGHHQKITHTSDLKISGGVSGHLLRATYLGLNKTAGRAMGIAPQLKLELDTQWSEANKTSLSLQLHGNQRHAAFQMQSYRLNLRYLHQASITSNWVVDLFHQYQQYDYEKAGRSMAISMRAQGLAIIYEKRI